MKLKDHSVKLGGVRPEIVASWLIAQPIAEAAGIPFLLTSVTDGKHGARSLHGKGLAYDLRCRQLELPEQIKLRDQLAAALGPEFDVVLERNPVHVHIEFDPK